MRYWKRIDQDGKTTTVESYSHNLEVEGAVEISWEEFNVFIATLPVTVPEPPRDFGIEIDDLKVRVEKLEKHK